MTEALASRVAGLKLGGIVAVLLVPMLILSFLMLSALREDIAHAEREKVGLELNRLVMPVAVASATGARMDDALARFRNEGASLARELGVTPFYQTAGAVMVTYGNDKRYAVDALAQLQLASADASGILLDPVPETYHQATVMSQHGPQLLADYAQMWTVATRAMRDGALSKAEISMLILAAGAWGESDERMSAAVEAAMAAAFPGVKKPELYKDVIAHLDELHQHPMEISRMLSRQEAGSFPSYLTTLAGLSNRAPHIISDIYRIWTFSADRFELLLTARLAAMRLKLYGLLAIAALACTVGVGGAALMFGKTLKQLDDVKLARDAAEEARYAAEESTEEIRRINEEVVRLNNDLARNLAMLREAQEDNLKKGRMAQLGQLTATVAHELRNPLGAVRTSAFLLERKVKGKGLGVEPQIERINNGVARCDNIISQLLDFARSKAISPETIAFDDWIVKLVEEEAQRLPQSVGLEVHLGTGDRALSFDPTRMSRVLINLINNASEALAGKGDEPKNPPVRRPVITITTRLTSRGAELIVADNGPGIPAEHRGKIFEPLFTTKSFGTGLGLPAVQKIMDQHGGGLEVASEPGQGAVFTAWWPAGLDRNAA